MNKENTQKLFKRFKFFRPEKSIKESLMSFGFEHGNGWFQLIWDLCLDIERILKVAPKHIREQFEVIQVKEKFGTLSFYCNIGTDEIFDRVNQAEEESAHICEECGSHEGKLYGNGWLKVRCHECKLKEKEQQNTNKE